MAPPLPQCLSNGNHYGRIEANGKGIRGGPQTARASVEALYKAAAGK
jgi:hypothetical protein